MCQENDNCPPLRNRTRNPDEYNDCNTDKLCEDNDNVEFVDDIDNASFTNTDDDSSKLLDIDYDDCMSHY